MFFFLSCYGDHRDLHSFPTRRSSDLSKVDGIVIAIKGEKAQEEIENSKKALHVLHGEVESMDRSTTGTVVVIRKKNHTPQKYPRFPGEPKRDPIGGKPIK